MARRIFAVIDGGAVTVAAPSGDGFLSVDAEGFNFRSSDEVVVFVPGVDVANHRVSLPAKSDREARQAAPFLIEDEVAVAVETLHVALGERGGAERELLVCSHDVMANWITLLDQYGLENCVLTPDYSALGEAAGAVDAGDRVLVAAPGRRFTLPTNAPAELAAAVLRQAGHDAQVSTSQAGSPVAALATLAAQTSDFIDLRQGAFATRRATGLPEFSAWARPLAIAAVAAMAWIGMLGLEAHQKGQAAEAMREEAQRLYADRFPAEAGATDPATRVQRKLRERTSNALDFQRTAAVLFAAIEDIDGASLRSLRFEQDEGTLRAALEYANYGDDLRLAEILNQAGLRANLGDSQLSGGVVSGDLVLETQP